MSQYLYLPKLPMLVNLDNINYVEVADSTSVIYTATEVLRVYHDSPEVLRTSLAAAGFYKTPEGYLNLDNITHIWLDAESDLPVWNRDPAVDWHASLLVHFRSGQEATVFASYKHLLSHVEHNLVTL